MQDRTKVIEFVIVTAWAVLRGIVGSKECQGAMIYYHFKEVRRRGLGL